jgi:spermine/spermidine synthase
VTPPAAPSEPAATHPGASQILEQQEEVTMSNPHTGEAAFVRHWATLAGVFCVSLSLLLGELLLTRVFSVLFMYHFAFMVISLALFGLGVGGIAVYLFPNTFGGDLQRRLVTLALCFTATLVLLVLFLFNLPLAASSGLRGILTVAAVYVMSALPFFVGGTCLSLLLGRAGQEVNRLYFVDLLGAGAACLLIIPALNDLGGVTALLLASAGAALAATMFAVPGRRITPVTADTGALLQRTLAVIAVAAGLAALLTIVAEPLAGWLGHALIRVYPKYAKHVQQFDHYFETLIRPEIHTISTATRIPLCVAFVLALGGSVAVRRLRARASGQALLLRQELRIVTAVVLAATVGLVVLNGATDAIRIRFAKGRVEFQNLFEGWNSFSRVAVLPHKGHGDNTYAWGLSPLYQGPPGEHLALDIDSLAGTPLVKFDGNLNAPGLEHLAHDVTALAYTLRPGRKALVIGPGGGRDVLTALKFGSRDVTAVELNPLMQEVVNHRFGDFTGRLYERPEITFRIDDGRHFVRTTDDRFGLIQLALVDTWASTAAGAFALSENTLYTREAFEDYLSRLEPDGVVTVTRWLDTPPRETLRVVTLARAALNTMGIDDVSRHILVAGTPPLRRGHRFASVIISRTPFTDAEIQTAKAFVDANGFDVLYMPGMARDPLFSEVVLTHDLPGFLERYELDVSPTTDDRPFFFNTVKARDFLRAWEDKPGRMGVQLLAELIVVVGALVALFMFVPLYIRRRSALAALEPRARWSTLFYFATLGAGFMLIEVSLISKFVLVLGHPIYALTIVLCTLLISAGVGSYWSGRNVGAGHAALRRVIGCALAAMIAAGLILEFAFGPLLAHASFAAAALLTVATLAPLGFLMGMPFPLGLRLLDRMGPQWAQLVPWVWGINGATSVLGSVLAISIAINFGFRMTMLAGLCIYAAAFLTAGYLAGGKLPAVTSESADVQRAAGGARARR